MTETTDQQTVYAVAYARVSTDDHDQNPKSQLLKIQEWAKAKGNIEIVREFMDKSTGTNTSRDGFYTMMGFLTSNRKVSKVIILDADRLSRSMDDAPKIIESLNDMGVQLTYVANESIDVSTLEGKMMNQFYTYAGEKYTEGLKLKIKAGMDRARSEGKHIGRPLKRTDDNINTDMLLIFAQNGKSLRDLGKIYNCSRNTIARKLRDENKLELFKKYYNESTGRNYSTINTKNEENSKTS